VDAADIFGPTASFMGVLMSLAPLFQVRRVLQRGQADDVSQAFLVVIAAGERLVRLRLLDGRPLPDHPEHARCDHERRNPAGREALPARGRPGPAAVPAASRAG